MYTADMEEARNFSLASSMSAVYYYGLLLLHTSIKESGQRDYFHIRTGPTPAVEFPNGTSHQFFIDIYRY